MPAPAAQSPEQGATGVSLSAAIPRHAPASQNAWTLLHPFRHARDKPGNDGGNREKGENVPPDTTSPCKGEVGADAPGGGRAFDRTPAMDSPRKAPAFPNGVSRFGFSACRTSPPMDCRDKPGNDGGRKASQAITRTNVMPGLVPGIHRGAPCTPRALAGACPGMVEV